MAHIQTLQDKNGIIKAYKAVVNRRTGDIKRPSKTFSVKKYGKKKAKEKAELWKARNMVKKDEGTFVDPSKITFSEFIDRWLEIHKKPNVEATTYDRYKSKIEAHIRPYFKDIRLQDVEPFHIESYFAEKRESGHRRKEGGLSENTLKKHYCIMNNVFKRAIKLKLLKFNPMDAIDPPKPEKKERPVMNEKEVNRLLDTIKDDLLMFTFIMCDLLTGMRRSEILGLEREAHVDLENRIIKVRKALVTVSGGIKHKDKPKNASSRRDIKISNKLYFVLKKYLNEMNKYRLKLGDEHNKENDFLFCKPNGEPYHPKHYNDKFNEYLDKAGLPQKYTIHTLRHTFATLQLKNKTKLELIKDMLGHSTIYTTADFYLHPDVEEQEEPMNRLDQVINYD